MQVIISSLITHTSTIFSLRICEKRFAQSRSITLFVYKLTERESKNQHSIYHFKSNCLSINWSTTSALNSSHVFDHLALFNILKLSMKRTKVLTWYLRNCIIQLTSSSWAAILYVTNNCALRRSRSWFCSFITHALLFLVLQAIDNQTTFSKTH